MKKGKKCFETKKLKKDFFEKIENVGGGGLGEFLLRVLDTAVKNIQKIKNKK
jgi:hypothetical protein